MPSLDKVNSFTATELAARIAAGELCPQTYVELALAGRADPAGTSIGLRRLASQRALEAGDGKLRGPLHGIPMGTGPCAPASIRVATNSRFQTLGSPAGIVPHDFNPLELARAAGAILVSSSNFASCIDAVSNGHLPIAASLASDALALSRAVRVRVTSYLPGVARVKKSKSETQTLCGSRPLVITRTVEDIQLVQACAAGVPERRRIGGRHVSVGTIIHASRTVCVAQSSTIGAVLSRLEGGRFELTNHLLPNAQHRQNVFDLDLSAIRVARSSTKTGHAAGRVSETPKFIAAINSLFEDVDFLLVPLAEASDFRKLTDLHASGLGLACVPVASTLPDDVVAIVVVGRPGSEAVMLDIARHLEAAVEVEARLQPPSSQVA